MSHAAPTLRLATRTDAVTIAQLSRDRIEAGLGWSWTPPRVLRSIRDREANVVVASDAADAGGMLGFGIMKYHDEEAHLLLLAVQAAHARQGIGRALVAWLEASARVAGIARIGLEARASNADARAFYVNLGYRETQSLAGYYSGREDCIRMTRDLRAERPVAG
ncbi:MAG TPA: GNAT family N-acetyltransferase [Burkholderiaceae bacterium]|jgi:ribosomal-protein-alanine N-acetyltransferase